MLAAFLKAIGFIIPLMDAMYANYYTREVMVILVREFQTPDEEMKKIVLKVGPVAHLWECFALGTSACVSWLALGMPTPCRLATGWRRPATWSLQGCPSLGVHATCRPACACGCCSRPRHAWPAPAGS